MHRSQVIQAILNQRKNATYLEIGVFKGAVFLPTRASQKIAVDPQFRIRPYKRVMWGMRNLTNLGNQYFEMPSDEFFDNHADVLEGGIDVAFVDGLHTYEQSYQDVKNCLKFLKDDGVIVMHDCDPPSGIAADPDRPLVIVPKNTQPKPACTAWTGDVYKALIRLRAENHDLNIFVLDCDYGLGVIQKGDAEAPLSFPVDQLSTLSFGDFQKCRGELLNLKPVEYFPEWLQRTA